MLKKVKNWLGIEGLKLQLRIDENLDLKKDSISGFVLLSSQSEQYVEALFFKMVEKYSRGRRKSKLIDEYEMGLMRLEVNQSIEAGGEIQIPFLLNYKYTASPMDTFGNKNWLYKGISTMAKFSKNAKSEFYIVCEAEVKGNALKPYDQIVLEMK